MSEWQNPPRPAARRRGALSGVFQAVAAAAVLIAVGVVVWAKVVHTTKESSAHAVGRITGRDVSCAELGATTLSQGTGTLLVCSDASGYSACWARFGDTIADVTAEVRRSRGFAACRA